MTNLNIYDKITAVIMSAIEFPVAVVLASESFEGCD